MSCTLSQSRPTLQSFFKVHHHICPSNILLLSLCCPIASLLCIKLVIPSLLFPKHSHIFIIPHLLPLFGFLVIIHFLSCPTHYPLTSLYPTTLIFHTIQSHNPFFVFVDTLYHTTAIFLSILCDLLMYTQVYILTCSIEYSMFSYLFTHVLYTLLSHLSFHSFCCPTPYSFISPLF